MKRHRHWTLALVAASALSLAGVTLARADNHGGGEKGAAHEKHAKHKHKHKKDCGHKAEKHGDHDDYEHDGHHHKGHAGHADECSGPDHSAEKSGGVEAASDSKKQ